MLNETPEEAIDLPSSSRTYSISFFHFLLVLMLSGCATFSPTNWDGIPQQAPARTYQHIHYDKLYRLFESVLEKQGYSIDMRDYGKGLINSSYREYAGEKKGLAIWNERRQYLAWFDMDHAIVDKHRLMFKLTIEERAPISSGWRKKSIETSADKEYQSILRELDDLVTNSGGTLQ